MTQQVVERPALPVLHAMTRQDRVPVRRYYDPDFYQMECELLWPRVWQMACRLDEIPKPGDFVEYENVGRSVVVVRVSETEVKAYHNACRHRGVKLVEGHGSLRSGFVCPFHGWCYGLDGANTFVLQPERYAEDNLDATDIALAECRMEIAAGCVFVNLDPDAPPLRDSIEPFATSADAWHADSLHVEWWLSARLPVNWKLAMEAFMEAWHVPQTHPQLIAPVPVRAGATASQILIDEQIHHMKVLNEGMAGMTHEKDIRVAEGLRDLELPADPALAMKLWRTRLNDAIVEWNRTAGMDVPDLNQIDALGLESPVQFCFPHYFLLPEYSSASSYRARPIGPEETIFEIWSLTRYPDGELPPRPLPPEPMAPDDPRWPAISGQDFSNLPKQQKGLHSIGFEYMRLSNDCEGLIGNYHRLIDGYLAGFRYDRLRPALHKVNGFFDVPVADLGF
jgi:phenylpropionate dioxygenase-like ring-hydroxylating dioxygenase large terminal subunit